VRPAGSPAAPASRPALPALLRWRAELDHGGEQLDESRHDRDPPGPPASRPGAGVQQQHHLVDGGHRGAQLGDLDGLRARADAGDWDAARRLAHLLARRGDLDGLRTRAHAGDRGAARRLADLLIKEGRGEEAERLRRSGLNADGSIACA
jgi:hypothetical protein